MARQIAALAPDVPLLVTHHVRRDIDYGLCFYRNQPLRHYLQENSATEKQSVITGIPNEEHILVLRSDDHTSLDRFVPGPHAPAVAGGRVAGHRRLPHRRLRRLHRFAGLRTKLVPSVESCGKPPQSR